MAIMQEVFIKDIPPVRVRNNITIPLLTRYTMIYTYGVYSDGRINVARNILTKVHEFFRLSPLGSDRSPRDSVTRHSGKSIGQGFLLGRKLKRLAAMTPFGNLVPRVNS